MVSKPAIYPPSQELQEEAFNKNKRKKWKQMGSKKMNSNINKTPLHFIPQNQKRKNTN